jgi:hypothetical protein
MVFRVCRRLPPQRPRGAKAGSRGSGDTDDAASFVSGDHNTNQPMPAPA